MFRRKIAFALLALLCAGGLALPARALDVDCDAVYCFSAGDFSGEENLAGVCITQVPEDETGRVLLGSRVVRSGDVLTADQLAQLTFCPVRSEADQFTQVRYLPIFADRVEVETGMDIAVFGKQNKAPVAEDSMLETYKNLPGEAMLKVKDPEGEKLTYTVTRQPRRGEVNLREDGSFLYVPKKNKVGVDSFSYTATDPQGSVSREATVTVTILKPTDSSQYSDTTGSDCRFAAEWMKNSGIFVGESLGGNSCFRPERQVSRGEFLTMLVGALNIPLEEDAAISGFTDEVPDWLKPYVAAAMRSGLTAGWPEGNVFRADQTITGAEAAVMLQNALDLPVPEDTQAAATDTEAEAPDWAAKALAALANRGITLTADTPLTRGQAANVLYQAVQLTQDAPGMTPIRIGQRKA